MCIRIYEACVCGHNWPKKSTTSVAEAEMLRRKHLVIFYAKQAVKRQ